MSETTTQNKAPNIPLRPITRNEASLVPVWQKVKRGEAKDVYYPSIVITPDNWNDYVKYKGLNNIIEKLNAKEATDAQATLDVLLTRKSLWVESYKQKEEVGSNGEKFMATVFEADGKTPVIESVSISEESLASVIDELLTLLESGNIQGGVTIKSLRAENETLIAELHENLANARKNPGDMTYLLKASELSERVQKNEAEINRISTERKSKLADAADKD